jgi:hypothetical protein
MSFTGRKSMNDAPRERYGEAKQTSVKDVIPLDSIIILPPTVGCIEFMSTHALRNRWVEYAFSFPSFTHLALFSFLQTQAAKMTNADSDKNRKRKEHQKRILSQQGGKPSGSDGKLSSTDVPQSSAFQELFTQRAQGFQIDFRFRNAPPRPPVGPTWVGHSLTQVLHDVSRQYQPSLQNSVEVNYKWKLHTESDLGIPLAPTAMDLKSYDEAAVVKDKQHANNGNSNNSTAAPLHPDDAALLDWKGAMGDTAADHLKTRRDRARAAARMAGMGKVLAAPVTTGAQTGPQKLRKEVKKKDFSRVLNDPLQTWMKKTTYLSNDYSRKVHDFKSLAQTKQELAVDLRVKQQEISLRHTALAVAESFKDMPLVHPTRKNLKPKRVMPLLPNVDNWGRAYTHVVIDKAPNLKNTTHTNASLNQAIIANVEKRQANAHMDCQLWVPAAVDDKKKDAEKDEDDSDTENQAVGDAKKMPFEPVQEFDLDVMPLKEENVPATNFCLWVDSVKGVATYVPLSSRVHLTTGRPVRGAGANLVTRRPVTDQERDELEERMAEVDEDMAEKHHVVRERYVAPAPTKKMAAAVAAGKDDAMNVDKNDDDEEEDDFGDDDSSEEDEAVFGGAKTIVAES